MDFLKVKNNFNFDFYSCRKAYGPYHNIHNRTNGEDYIPSGEKLQDYTKKDIIVINNIPAYFDAKLNKTNETYKCFKIHYLDGFFANLKEFINLDDYLKSQFGAKSRSRLRSFVNRLETCFAITYKMYYGAISKNEFHLLMDALETMISKRFLERGDTHESLKNWNHYKNSAYDMILEKKASLFVIYDGNKPIDISLNYHHQNILFGNIKSYDIDYSKFRLGSIDIIKILEWCFNNNYTIIDFSHGNLSYKHSWCNTNYVFEHHILYNYRKKHKQVMAYIMFQILQLKAFLKKRKIDLIYHKLIGKIKKTNTRKQLLWVNNSSMSTGIAINSFDVTLKSLIDLNSDEFAYLRKTIYDFQYLNFEFSGDIKVYRLLNKHNEFIVQGLKKTMMFASVDNPLNE